MNNPQQLITDNLNIWTAAIKKRGSQGRGSSKKLELHGIKKLRELILELAVRGLLVPQNPNDDTASVLLEKIAAEKEQLIKDGKIKKQKPLPEISDDEKPFALPKGWSWSRIGDFSLIGPRNTLDDDLEVSFVPMPLVSTSYKGDHGQETRMWSELKKGYTHFADGDIGLAKITPCFENSKAAIFKGLINGFGAGTTELHIARPLLSVINPLFVLLYLKAPMFLEVGKTKMTGSAGQKRIPKSFFEGNPFPLPPEAEQPRIVAKVDELMALCDQLEQQTEDSLTAHQTLVETLLNSLLDAAQTYPGHASDASRDIDGDLKDAESSQKDKTNSDPFQQAWQRIWDNFDVLFVTEHSIDQLKQTILQLAVMGKLVPQNENDEPASVLLEKIAAEKEQLIKDKKIKKQKPLPEITDEEKPFELPKGWEWARVDTVSSVTGGIQKQQKRRPIKNIYPYLRVANVKRGLISVDELERFELFDGELEKYALIAGDILIVEGNGSEDEIGRCAIWGGQIDNCVHQNHLIRLRVLISGCEEFFEKFLNSPTGIAQMKALAVTSSGLYNLSVGKIKPIVVPIPPRGEQSRIVAKVDELMALCDTLKERIRESQTTQFHLADAMVEQALS